MSIRAAPSDIEVVVPSGELGLGAAFRVLHRYLAESLPHCRLVEAAPSGDRELAGTGRVFLFPTEAWG
jgi:hypothetical protein